MNYRNLLLAVVLLTTGLALHAQEPDGDSEELKLAAVEALILAPPERALPAVRTVLAGNNSNRVKESALFILSQIRTAEAQELLLETARTSEGDLQEDAIVMIGVGGNPDALAGLRDLYLTGNSAVREAVLEAYLIVGDRESIYQLALAADNEDDLEEAVEMLGAMGAIDELRVLLDQLGPSESLMEAFGIAGVSETDQTLLQVYRESTDQDVREAALEGLMISGNDGAILELYRESTNTAEKAELLEILVGMGSEEVWDLIDETLADEQ